MPEGFHLQGVLLKVVEWDEVGVESFVERKILCVVHVLVFVVFEPLGESGADGCMDFSDVWCCAFDVGIGEGVRDAVGEESVFRGLVDE